MKTGFALSVLLVLLSAEACKPLGAESSTAQKDPTSGAGSDDQADAPAPVAGAYLSCLVAKPKANDDYLNAGCQLRNPSKVKVDCKNMGSHLWSYLPPKATTTTATTAAAAATTAAKPAVEVFDLCNDPKKSYYFQVGMRMKIAKPAGTGLALTGDVRQLALADTQRKLDAEFFLSLKPVIVFNPVLATAAGLALTIPNPAPATVGLKAVVSNLNYLELTHKVDAAKNNQTDPNYMPTPIREASADTVYNGSYDQTKNTVQPPMASDPPLTAGPSGPLDAVVAPTQVSDIVADPNADPGVATDAVAQDIAANTYWQQVGDTATAFDPIVCAATVAGLKDRFDNHTLSAADYEQECNAKQVCDAASCVAPTGG